MPELIVFIIGLAAAIRGADWLGRAAIALAKQLGVPHIIIGATVVSAATTLPELAIATISGWVNEDPQLALGIVIGSPLTNLGIILGLFFLFSKHKPKIGYYSRSINLVIVLSLLLLVITLNRPIGGLLSFLLIVLGILFILLELAISQKVRTWEDRVESRFETFLSIWSITKDKSIFFELILGTIFLAVGSKFLVDSTFSLAQLLNVNEFFVSMTFLALGTSFPELITTINSIVKNRLSLSVGNLVGASVIDLTFGVGLGTLFNSGTVETPSNYIVFSALIVIGILSLLVLWKKMPPAIIGGALVLTSLIFLTAFTILTYS